MVRHTASCFALVIGLVIAAPGLAQEGEGTDAANAKPVLLDPATGNPFPTVKELSSRTPIAGRKLTAAESAELSVWIAAMDEASNQKNWPEAFELAKKIIATQDILFGPEHPELLATLRVAEVYARTAKMTEAALPLSKRRSELSRKLLGARHPDSLRSFDSYANLLKAANRPGDAEPLFAEVLKLRREIFGARHPDTLTSLNNYALVLRTLGRTGEAEPLLAEALKLRRETLGPRHPGTIASLNNYASVLNALGRPAEAEPIYFEALKLYREVLGPRHVNTLVCLSNYVSVLDALGRNSEVDQLYAELLMLRREVLGPSHKDTLSTINAYASHLRKLGRNSEAEPLYAEAMKLYRETLGPRHSSTLASLNNYALVLEAQGRADEAEPLLAEALKVRTEVQGADHPDTLATLMNYAAVLDTLGRYDEAEPIYAKALKISRETLGPRHPTTLVSLSNYALLLDTLGRPAEAEPLYVEALKTRREVLGPNHPDTVGSLNNYAGVLYALGRYQEAEPLFAETLKLFREALGPRHPETLISLNNYAALLDKLGKTDKAEPLYAEALKARREVLGPRHPDTLASLNNYAGALMFLGRFEEAEPLYAEALKFAGEIQGKRHPTVITFAKNTGIARLFIPERASEALPPLRQALESLRSRFADTGNSGVRGEVQQDRDRVDLQGAERLFADAAWVRAEAKKGEKDSLTLESFDVLQGALAGAAARAIAETAARRHATDAGAGALVEERRQLVEKWSATEQALVAAQSASDTPSVAKRAADQADMDRLEARIKAVDIDLKAKAPKYFEIVNQAPLSVKEAQALLKNDEAAILVVPSRFGTHVMVVSQNRPLAWHHSALDDEEIAAKVTKLRQDLDPDAKRVPGNPDVGQTDWPFDRGTAYELYRELIAPIASELVGKSHVFIAADGALASLPFGVLVSKAPANGSRDDDAESLRATSWFGDDHALIQLPSLQALAFLRKHNERASSSAISSPGYAAFGDPVLGAGTDTSRGDQAAAFMGAGVTDAGSPLMDPDLLRTLGRIKGTSIELTTTRTLLGAPEDAVRLEGRMTEADIRSAGRLKGVRILHLATHGLKAAESGRFGQLAEPGLVFTPPVKATSADDGYLAASEIVGMDLTALDWVILSACNTAAASGKPNEGGLSGLARAFFYAGAPSLIASHWSAYDDVAPQLISNTLKRTRNGESRAEALQHSMQDIRNNKTFEQFAHPASWAVFAIVGEGR